MQNNLHNAAFIKQYCFGFYPGDTVVSQSHHEKPHNRGGLCRADLYDPDGYVLCGVSHRPDDNVWRRHRGLNWASQISGVPAATIQNLAIAYATTKPSCIYGDIRGASEVGRWLLHRMMAIALAAMTGQSNLIGGGPGISS